MSKNILLPGGIGYIGSHVMVDLLLKTTYNITIIDNYLNSTQATLQRIYDAVATELDSSSLIQAYKARVSFYEGNILNVAFLQTIFQTEHQNGRDLTTIIHFAAKKSAPESMLEPLDYYENNLVGSINLLKMMEKYATCTEFIFSSTAAVYGEQDNCTEEFHCLPVSPYGQSKLCVDMLLKSMANCHKNWRVISLRYFNPAGNHQSGIIGDNPIGNIPGNLFAVIQEYIIGKRSQLTVYGQDYNTPDGSGVRDFVHVTDLSEGHLKALDYLQNMTAVKNYDVFNFGSGNGFSVLQVIQTFEELLGNKINYEIGPRRPGDMERLVTASKRAELILGWKTKKTLRQMCESCIAFTRQLVRKPQQ